MGGWDAENKGWVYIAEFINLRPKWFDDLKKIATDTWNGWGVATTAAPTVPPATPPDLEKALLEIIDAAGEREDRFAEILHQRDADGCIMYWMGTLSIESSKHRHTYELIRFARKLGEMIVMCLKAELDAARPSQICPAIVPAFDAPHTASFPAGHALQSYLTAYLLLRVMPKLPQSAAPGTWGEQRNGLFALARRISDNRVIAGVHFDVDNEAGFLIAKKIDEWFTAWVNTPAPAAPTPDAFGNLRRLLAAAKAEFPQWN